MIPIKSGTFTILQVSPGMSPMSRVDTDFGAETPGATPLWGVRAQHTDGTIWQLTLDQSIGPVARGQQIVIAAAVNDAQLYKQLQEH